MLSCPYRTTRDTLFPDPISSLFEPVYQVSSWQDQLVETHALASSGASQFLIAGTYAAGISKVKNSSRALLAFSTTLSFVPARSPTWEE